jgi:hypothetical protein
LQLWECKAIIRRRFQCPCVLSVSPARERRARAIGLASGQGEESYCADEPAMTSSLGNEKDKNGGAVWAVCLRWVAAPSVIRYSCITSALYVPMLYIDWMQLLEGVVVTVAVVAVWYLLVIRPAGKMGEPHRLCPAPSQCPHTPLLRHQPPDHRMRIQRIVSMAELMSFRELCTPARRCTTLVPVPFFFCVWHCVPVPTHNVSPPPPPHCTPQCSTTSPRSPSGHTAVGTPPSCTTRCLRWGRA